MNTQTHYRRPMGRWYLRPFYLFVYTLRELTAVFVLAYALILLAGLYAMASGPDAWDSYRQLLTHPLSIALHGLILIAALYNSITWFMVAPKAMPALFIGTRPVPGWLITLGHIVAFVVVSIVLLVLIGAG